VPVPGRDTALERGAHARFIGQRLRRGRQQRQGRDHRGGEAEVAQHC